MANKKNKKKVNKKLRRNRLIGLLIFVILAIACRQYYLYCNRNDPKFLNGPGLAERERLSSKTAKPEEWPEEDLTETSFDTNSESNPAIKFDNVDFSCLELPYFDIDEFIIFNEAGRYTLQYDTLYRQAAWVAYLLTREDIETNNATRKNKFIPDPEVVNRGYPTAHTKHYTNSGYDRGHLCPSADRNSCQDENDHTFNLSNISPQTPTLNRGIWKNLEDQVREWAVTYDSLYVVTGGILENDLPTINGGIGIPNLFYKTVLTQHEGEFHAIAFIIPNADNFDCSYQEYAVCVDSLQQVSSINFYHNLPAEIEAMVESEFSYDFWFP